METLAREAGLTVRAKRITRDEVVCADEVFLTNVVQGLRWVGSYRTKRYFNGATTELVDRLNSHILAEIQA